MKNKIYALAFVVALAFSATTAVSCSSDDSIDNISTTPSKLTVNLSGENIASVKNVSISFKETNTGETKTFTATTNSLQIELKKGSYTVTANGTVALTTGEEIEAGGNAVIDLTQDVQNMSLTLGIKIFSGDFIIEEVFFTGVQTVEGKTYNSGKYFKLTNNTDKTLNTGGLLILKSELNPSTNNTITPEIRATDFAVSGAMMIPLNLGKDVAPGDFVVIADMATNHKTASIPAYDLSGADYEYPNLENAALGQVDNPSVPNTKVIFSTANNNLYLLHNRGFESYAIARFPATETAETWLANYKYDYEYPNQAGNTTKKSAYKIPNLWILDGVNCSVEAKWTHNPLHASIDSGWTGCGTIDSDPARYGKTVRRKIIGKMENGKNIYKDTNNSTEDFVKTSPSSFTNGIIR